MKLLLESWEYLAVIVMFTIVIAVADMNWPEHMGGGGHLMRALGILN
jgi:hypothetical protein